MGYTILLKCPEDSDDFTVDFYNSQLDALEFVALGCDNIMVRNDRWIRRSRLTIMLS